MAVSHRIRLKEFYGIQRLREWYMNFMIQENNVEYAAGEMF